MAFKLSNKGILVDAAAIMNMLHPVDKKGVLGMTRLFSIFFIPHKAAFTSDH